MHLLRLVNNVCVTVQMGCTLSLELMTDFHGCFISGVRVGFQKQVNMPFLVELRLRTL